MTSNEVQDQKILSLEKRADQMNNAINGNGQKGLKQVAEATSTKVGLLIWFIGIQTTAMVSGFAALIFKALG